MFCALVEASLEAFQGMSHGAFSRCTRHKVGESDTMSRHLEFSIPDPSCPGEMAVTSRAQDLSSVRLREPKDLGEQLEFLPSRSPVTS